MKEGKLMWTILFVSSLTLTVVTGFFVVEQNDTTNAREVAKDTRSTVEAYNNTQSARIAEVEKKIAENAGAQEQFALSTVEMMTKLTKDMNDLTNRKVDLHVVWPDKALRVAMNYPHTEVAPAKDKTVTFTPTQGSKRPLIPTGPVPNGSLLKRAGITKEHGQ